MPSLVLLYTPMQPPPFGEVRLSGDTQVLGRDSKRAQIVVPDDAVSRSHARITSVNGTFYLEDLGSRNRTFVNREALIPHVPIPLRPNDNIKICDFLFQFRDERPPKPSKLPAEMQKGLFDNDDPNITVPESGNSTLDAQELIRVTPADRLRALLSISANLSKTLELDQMLAMVADDLLGVFKQADRCFILMLDSDNRPIPRIARGRLPTDDTKRFSKTILRNTIESGKPYLCDDACESAELAEVNSITEMNLRSVICVPLASADGRPLGAIQLDTLNRAKKFVTEDLNLLTIVANLANVAFDKARMHEAVLAREKAQQEIELARTVQLGFLPQTLPVVKGYEFFSHYSPARTVSGDYYDFVPLSGGRLGIVLGDVAGKGVPAALLVAKLCSEVRFCLCAEADPANAISRLNDQLIRGGLQELFVTFVAMVLDPVAHQVTIVNAGHIRPKLYRGTRGILSEAITRDSTGFPLGVEPDFQYASTVVPLDPGDMLTAYTDGVMDAMNAEEELFGLERLTRALTPNIYATADGGRPVRIGEQLIGEVHKHANGAAQNDDIAVVCFGRVESGEGGNTSLLPALPTTRRLPQVP